MSVLSNNKMVFKKRYETVYESLVKDYNTYYKKDYDKINDILENLIERNYNTVKEIKNERNKEQNFQTLLNKKKKLLKKIEKQVIKNTNINLEKDTFINISKQKNSNIEIYYMVYILVSVILLLIEGSIILFK